MNKLILILVGMTSAAFGASVSITNQQSVERFLFVGDVVPQQLEPKLDKQVDGVQAVYSWRSLEPQKDKYDFSQIEADLKFLNSKSKKLWLQIQDRFFEHSHRFVPEYILTEAVFEGGLAPQKDNAGENQPEGRGWVSKQWVPSVRDRFQKLIEALAKRFDGRVYGINLPETSADIDIVKESTRGFSCDKYINATIENIEVARNVFKISHVVQYVNFWPCEWNNDHGYMERFFAHAIKHKIGLGGPDIVPYRQGQMKNSYPFFNKHKGQLPVIAFAVQEPTRTYINPNTGRKFTDDEFLKFGQSYLGATIIFWSLN